MKILKRILTGMTRNPLFLFIPFVVIYLAYYFLGFPKESLETIFRFGNGVFLVVLGLGFLIFASERKKEVWFWLLLFLLLLASGAYLEYPSDPWEHVRRAYLWQSFVNLAEHSDVLKFSYFWHWTFIKGLSVHDARIVFDLISAFWQMMMAYYFYRLCWHLGMSAKLSYLQLLGFFLLFGTNIFSMRYYALSSTPLAFCAYFELLTVLSGLKRVPLSRVLIKIPPLLLLIFMGHRQGFLFLAATAPVIIFWKVYGQRLLSNQKSARRLGLWLFGLGALVSMAIALVSWRSQGGTFGQGFVHPLGIVKIWRGDIRYFSTLGIAGIISIFLAIRYFKRWPLIAMLTLAPTVFLLFPWVGIGLRYIFAANPDSVQVIYRVLFAFPSSVFLIIWFYDFLQNHSYRRLAFLGTATMIVVFAAIPFEPFWGKLAFQFYLPNDTLKAKHVDELVPIIKRLDWGKNSCSIATDSETSFVLGTFLGATKVSSRLQPRLEEFAPDQRITYLDSTNLDPCIFIVYKHLDRLGDSSIAKWSGHWDPRYSAPSVQAKYFQTLESTFAAAAITTLETDNYRLYLTK